MSRRTYKDPRQQRIYDDLRSTPPSHKGTGLGQAYYQGFEHPDDPPKGPRPGLRGSDARVAWAAGVDNARAIKKEPS